MKKFKQVCLNVEDLEIGDRFICQVSTSPSEKDIIPGQTSGSRYYPRITSIKKTRWYVEFNTQCENQKFEEVSGLTNVISHKRQNKTFVLRKR